MKARKHGWYYLPVYCVLARFVDLARDATLHGIPMLVTLTSLPQGITRKF
jgi:hypothetical protein